MKNPFYRGGPGTVQVGTPCIVSGCLNNARAKHCCSKHYQEARRQGFLDLISDALDEIKQASVLHARPDVLRARAKTQELIDLNDRLSSGRAQCALGALTNLKELVPGPVVDDAAGLHMLYVKWACKHLTMVNRMIRELGLASNLNTSELALALSRARDEMIQRDPAWKDARDILNEINMPVRAPRDDETLDDEE